MTKKRSLLVVAVSAFVLLGGSIFQNCAKAKWVDPDLKHSAFAMGYCQSCGDESGQGVTCRTNLAASFANCNYESCNSGFQLIANRCEPVVCEAGAFANCEIPHGQGRKQCNNSGNGYGVCHALECESGYEIKGNECVLLPVCEPGQTLSCDSDTTYGTRTCNEDRAGYGECVLGECKSGFHKNSQNICVADCEAGYEQQGDQCVPLLCGPGALGDCEVPNGHGKKQCNNDGHGYGSCDAINCLEGYELIDGRCELKKLCEPGQVIDCGNSAQHGTMACLDDGSGWGKCDKKDCNPGHHKDDENECVPNTCEPGDRTTCTDGAGIGWQTCNSIGSGYGSCVIESCEDGYVFKNGVCVVKVCTPNTETAACNVNNGSGIKTCNSDGTDWGPCDLLTCTAGHSLVEKECKQNQCEPLTATSCQVESGTGTKYCYQNGQGHGPCGDIICNPGFRLKNGVCVAMEPCETGETMSCAITNGTGSMVCKDNQKWDSCKLVSCNSGYTKSGQTCRAN